MATISDKSWTKYITRLRNLSDKAAEELIKFINNGHDIYADSSMDKVVIDYAYGLATKYGEGAGALASEMYDALAELSGKVVPPAVPAPTAKYGEVAKAIYGTKLQSSDPEVMAGSIGRLVKMAGVDTMQQNALRDGAEWAWIPRGDTCAFCLALASRGWQKASRSAIKNGHAEHVHANCDCTYAIRFSDDVNVEGYDPEEYKQIYEDAKGDTFEEKINYIRRSQYTQELELKLQKEIDDMSAKRKDLFSKALNDPSNFQYYNDEILRLSRELSGLEFKKQAELNERMYNDPAVKKARDKSLKALEKEIGENGYETMCVVDKDGSLIEKNAGGYNYCTYEAKNAENNYTIHNHPENKMFSPEDLDGICNYGEIGSSVITRDGQLFTVERDFRNPKIDSIRAFYREYEKAYDDIYNAVDKEADGIENFWKLPYKDISEYFSKNMNERLIEYCKKNCSDYGIKFTVQRRK